MNASWAEQIEAFHELIEQRFGLVFDRSRSGQVAEIFDARRAELKKSPCEYLGLLREDSQEWQTLGALLTVPETYFFRGTDHFRAFEEIAIPSCMQARGSGRVLRILSIGCATGEEPYTIAISRREQPQRFTGWSVQIIGLDLSQAILDKARAGIYGEWSLRATPLWARQKYFKKAGKQYQLDREILESAAFDVGNVLQLNAGEYRDSIDVVFFRNVLMYFSPNAANVAISQIAHVLQPGGYLFLGPAESLRGISRDFHLCHTHDNFYYRRKDEIGELLDRADSSLLPQRSTPAVTAQPTMASGVSADFSDLAAVLEDVSWFEAILESGRRIQELEARNAAGDKNAPETAPPAGSAGGSAESARETLLRLLRQESYDEALSMIRKLPRQIGDNKEILLLETVLMLNRGESKDAEARCRLLLEENEMDATAHYAMALCHEQQLDAENAVSHDRTAIYLDPTFAMPHLHLALMLKKNGELRAAKREFREAVRLFPGEVEARLVMFSGGFGQRGLIQICEREIESLAAA